MNVENANELSPVDLTFLFPGAGINQNDLRNENWIGGLTTGGPYENRNAEKWNTASFDINQTVSGLPNGFYRVSVQGFYRVGGGANNPTIAASEYAAGTPTLNAIFYANEASRPLMSIMAEAKTDADSLTEKYYDGLAYGYKTDLGVVPHCQHGAAHFFNEGLYTQSIIAEVVDGTLKVGVKKDVGSTNDWVVFDNFKLEYAGTDCATGTNTVELEEGTPYYLKHVSTGLYLEGGNSWGTQASLGRVGVDVSFANIATSLSGVYGIFTIDTKVSNLGYTQAGAPQYLALDATNGQVYLDQDAQNWTVTRLDNGNYTLKCNDGRYLNSAEGTSALTLGNFGAESEWQMVTKEERLADLNVENANELSPADLTFMLPGAGFNQNDTRNENWVGNPKLDGPYENRNAEKWFAASFDINQTVSGLPNGFYRVSVQGFYRVGGDGTTHSAIVSANEYAAGNPTLNAIFYANGASKPLMSIMAEAKADADSLTTISSGGNSYGYKTDLGVVPNSQNGAAHFFNEGLYTQSIIAEVVDGTLKVGVKKDVAAGDDWVVFDNFHLSYLGTQEPAQLEDAIYYLKNVATGLYLVPGNNWEKQASLGTIPFDFHTYLQADGTYVFDSHILVNHHGHYADLIRHYLGAGGYVDQPLHGWILLKQENGNYAISFDGTNLLGYDGESSILALNLTDASSSAAQWQFLTKEEVMAEMSEKLSKATYNEPQEATFFIEGASFRRHDDRNAAWKGNPQLVEYEPDSVYAGQWVGYTSQSFDIYQTLRGLPNGYYTVKVQGAYRETLETYEGAYKAGTHQQNAYLYANNVQTPLMSLLDDPKEGTSFDTENYTNTEFGYLPNGTLGYAHFIKEGHWSGNSILVEVTDDTLRLGVRKEIYSSNDWTIFDNFELWYMGTEAPKAPAYNAFVLNDTTLRAGQSMLLPVALDNESEFTAFQCDIYLPEGITLQTNKGKYDITLDEERMNDQTISSALQEDGSIRMAVASLTSSLFSGNSGNLFYLNLLGGENISGDLTISIKNIHISAVDGTMYDLEDVTATITVPSYTPADVNDDGMIAINDVVLTINAVLGTYADNFVFAAADMNGDNQIMINDVVQVINSVLGLNTTSVLTARHIVRETLDITETQNGFGMSLSNAGGYVAMQYDMTLPAGVSIDDIRVTAGSNHSVSFREVGDGQVRVAVVSLTNEAFASGSLLEVSVSAESATSISITNAYVATRRGVMVEVADAEVQLTRGGATGIQAVGVEVAPADIFDLSGRIVKKAATSLEGLDKGVYLMNGKKVVVK